MKKILSVLIAVLLLFSFTACNSKNIVTEDHGNISIFVNGNKIYDITSKDFQKNCSTKVLDNTTYYGKEINKIIKNKIDVNTIKALFTKSNDNTASYFSNLSNLFIATHMVKNNEYTPINNNDNFGFLVLDDYKIVENISDIYLLNKPQDWNTKININGIEKNITINDFMSMSPMYKTLSHKYDGGASTFEGEFLSVSTKNLMEYFGVALTEGTNDNGEKVYYSKHNLITFVGGVQSSSTDLKIEKNKDLKSSPFVEKSGWLVNYFVLVNGNDHHDIVNADLGLSCILNGTGIRWMCTPLQSISIEHSDEVKW